jgi:putative glutamine amidotransferase
MKPIIGITCLHDWAEGRHRQNDTYINAISKAGGIPILLPCLTDANDIETHLTLVHGLVISGGPDADPCYFNAEPEPGLGAVNPEMDAYEVPLIQRALELDMPILGICRGEQMLNIAAGGTLIQHIPASVAGALKHRQEAPRHYPTHTVQVAAETKLAAMLGEGVLRVNTFHHQSVRDLAPGFVCSAVASDGIVEAIESSTHSYAVGVQWHPEGMWNTEFNYDGLFDGFIVAAGVYGGK